LIKRKKAGSAKKQFWRAMDRRSFAYGLHCKESNLDHQRPIKESALSKIALAAAPPMEPTGTVTPNDQ